MNKTTYQKLCKAAAAAGAVILLAVGILTAVRPGSAVSAVEPGVAETEEVSAANGKGPKEVTSLEDMGITDTTREYGTYDGAISGNKIDFVDTSQTGKVNYEVAYHVTSSGTNSGIPISLEHSWVMRTKIQVARTEELGRATSIYMRLNDGSSSISFGINNDTPAGVLRRELLCGGIRKNISASYLGVYQPLDIIYNKANNAFTVNFGNQSAYTISVNNSLKGKEARWSFSGLLMFNWPQSAQSEPSGYTRNKVAMDFISFQYTDLYMKADNTLKDYADRKITGAIGNGHTIQAETKIYNSQNDSGQYSQRYAGKVDWDRDPSAEVPLTNLTLANDIASQPKAFQMSGSPFETVSFKARVDTRGADYSAGQMFRLPLRVSDTYFGSEALKGLGGVPGDWYHLKKDDKEQLPLVLNVERNTCRPLVSDLEAKTGYDYSHTVNNKQIEPNSHGWYSSSVSLNLQNVGDAFNELNLSTAGADEEITSESIRYTGTAADSITVQGSGDDGNSPDTDGDTFLIFGRKGTAKETEDLSAVTTETFRIDKTKPTLKSAEKEKEEDRRTLKAEDNLSGIDYIKWKGPKDSGYPQDSAHIIQIEKNSQAAAGVLEEDQIDLPVFTEFGTYTFCAVDLAGNESKELTVTNNRPVLKAYDAKVSFVDTITQFSPYKIHKAAVSDKEDDLKADRVTWTISRTGYEDITGNGEDVLTEFLPIGTYTVSFTLDGEGTDSDGNKPDPSPVKVTLVITSGDPPAINDRETPAEDPVDGKILVQKDGTRHYLSEDTIGIIADPKNPYNGGVLTEEDIKKAIEDKYKFKSKLPAPANGLTVTISIQDDRGNDITDSGIPTDSKGEFLVVYCVTDASGCSTTLQRTYQLKEDAIAVFYPGKGDFRDGSQSKTVTVKIGKAPDAQKIPGADSLEPPVEKCFIGWGTKPGAAKTVKPETIVLKEDTSYYAVYAEDANRDDIPDSEQALFYFKSGDPVHAAFKYADKTVIGILVPDGAKGYLAEAQIPELLFEQGYRLKGWKTDTAGDKLLSTEALTGEGRARGTKTTVTAVIEENPIDHSDKVIVTFFSSEPGSSPLKGGEGQTITIDAPKPDRPVTIPKSSLPDVKLGQGCELKGWKTSDTGDLIMEADTVASRKLYGGRELTCIAYVDTPEKVKEKKKEIVTKEVDVKVKGEVLFAFYSSDDKAGIISGGEGDVIRIAAKGAAAVSLGKARIPRVKPAGSHKFLGWKTNMTGNRILTDRQLAGMRFASGSTVNCTAWFKLKNVKVEERDGSGNSSTQVLTTFDGEQVPLGASAGNFRREGSKPCVTHWIMLVWIGLSVLSMFWRLHRRKKAEEEEGQEPLATNASDYVFMAGDLMIGIILYIMGSCFWELPGLIAGAVLLALYLIRMKILDKKEQQAYEAAEQ